MNYKAPDPGKGWRLLGDGERITRGAEAIDTTNPNDKWDEVFLSVGFKLSKSLMEDDGIFLRVRCKQKTINYQRLALLMSKAPSIREARKIYGKAVGK